MSERATGAEETTLFEPGERETFEGRWQDIQGSFVDEPRTSVEQANNLVAELMERFVSTFNAERAGLEAQWDRGDDVTTEELRRVLKRYRAFFGRILELQRD